MKYCSDRCAGVADRQHDREGKNHDQFMPFCEKTCPDCGVTFFAPIKSYRCHDCQWIANQRHNADYQARKRQGNTRPLGSLDTCTVCGKLYTVNSGLQKYCPACKEAATREAVTTLKREKMREAREDPERREADNQAKRRKPRQKVCQQCGAVYMGTGNGVYCSSACRAASKKQYYADYDAKRMEEKSARQKEKYKNLTPEQRKEVNRKARENYAKRKAKAKKEENQ